MPVLYVIGGVVSLALLVYLFVALLKPEAFSVSWQGYAQIVVFLVVARRARRSRSAPTWRASTRASRSLLEKALGPLERLVYRALRRPRDAEKREMTWKTYAVAMLLFNVAGILAVYALQRLQGILPLNPQGMRRRLARSRRSTPPSASPRTRTGRATAARRR